MRIILASQSITRGRAFDILGLSYEKIPSYFDETAIQDSDPKERARRLAEAKARTVGEREHGIIVAGDLFCVMDGKTYEKPKTKEEATAMLLSFSEKEMDVIAGTAVYDSAKKKMLSGVKSFTVRFRKLEERDVASYVARYPVTKFAAGWDGDGGLLFLEHAEGTFPFMTGLPLPDLVRMLREHGVGV